MSVEPRRNSLVYISGTGQSAAPFLILTRNEMMDHLNEIIVAPVTRTIRGLSTEVVLSPDEWNVCRMRPQL
jgi:mRNA interferase MazF